MKARHGLTRRSFLSRIAAGTMIGGSALVMVGGEARAFQYSDKDQGPLRDRVGHGRSRPARLRNGAVDRDAGPNADPGPVGGRVAFSGATDADSGSGADPQGFSRSWRSRATTEERERLIESEEENGESRPAPARPSRRPAPD